MGTPEDVAAEEYFTPPETDLVTVLSEGIEEFMASVPGDPSQCERDWRSDDMAKALLNLLAENGCVRLSEDQEMPHITEGLAKLSLELVKGDAEPFTAIADLTRTPRGFFR